MKNCYVSGSTCGFSIAQSVRTGQLENTETRERKRERERKLENTETR